MRTYAVGRDRQGTEWTMFELDHYGVRPDMLQCIDGVSMRAVLVFAAPDWGKAWTVYSWARESLGLGNIKPFQRWEEVQLLMEAPCSERRSETPTQNNATAPRSLR